MLQSCISVGRIQPRTFRNDRSLSLSLYIHIHIHINICIYTYIHTHTHIYIYIYIERERDKLVSFQEDLSWDPSHSKFTLRHSNTRFIPLKLIYIISSIYKTKIKFFEYILPIHQIGKKRTA